MKPQNHSFLRFICFLAGAFCSIYVIDAIREKELSVPLKRADVIISQASDPHVFWGMVIFMSLMAAILLYCTFFAKDR